MLAKVGRNDAHAVVISFSVVDFDLAAGFYGLDHFHDLRGESAGILKEGHTLQAGPHVLDAGPVAVLAREYREVLPGIPRRDQRVGDAVGHRVVGRINRVQFLALGAVTVGRNEISMRFCASSGDQLGVAAWALEDCPDRTTSLPLFI